MKDNKNYWDNWGAKYSQVWENKAKQELSKKELSFINKYVNIKKPIKILDLGVGNGRILENMLENAERDSEIFGLDVSDKMVNICREKFKNETTIKHIEVCDISQTDICFDNNFDFVTAIRVLKYNKNWIKIIERVYNKLNSGGVFIFSMPNIRSVAALKKDTFTEGKIEINYTDKKQVENILRKIGYQSCKIVGFSKIPNVFYDFSNNDFYVKLLLWSENFLEIIFGKSFLARYFFIICKK